MVIESALRTEAVDEAADILRRESTWQISSFEEALPTALQGGYASVVVVTRSWDSLLHETLAAASTAVPGAVSVLDTTHVQVHGRTVDWLTSALRSAVADAPFSAFVARFGPGTGMALACVARVRETIAELPPLVVPNGDIPEFDHPVDTLRFRRLVDLAIRGMAPPLDRVRDALGLSTAELGELFGVSRQAVEQWRARGVPPDRRAKVADLVAVVDLLDRKLKPGRLPLVARRPAAAFGGKSLIEHAAAGEHAELRASVERAFDWSTAA
jgi:hypothetical protein